MAPSMAPSPAGVSEPVAEPTPEPTAEPTVEPPAEPTAGPAADEPTADEPTTEPSEEPRYGIEFREFNFAKYPSHVANLHCYAWKPPIIDEVLQESSANTVVMWVDSGATVVMSLRKVIDLTKKNGGFLSDETAKGLARFSHEKQLDYAVQKWGLSDAFATKVKELRAQGEGFLDNNDRLGEPFSKFRNCNGAFSAHMKGSRRYESVTKPWVACSLDRACVCPQGSHRGNARQGQSALTLLAVHNDYVCGSDGKTVAAHGLRDIRGVLNANGAGWTARKEAQLFCPSPVAEGR